MSLNRFRFGTGAALAAVMTFAGGAAVAQQSMPQQAQPQMQQPEVDPVSDAEIEQFVAANGALTEIAEEATPKLQAAEDQAAAQEIEAEAQAEMIAAIKAEGLTAQRFTQIVQLAQVDAELATKIRAEMNS